MKISGARRIVESLAEQKVAVTFGMPGSHNLELVDALIDSGINNILVTSELSAVFMADGYARVTGRVGVCIVIPGPGLTNMVTGLAEAFLDSSPVVVIVPTTPRDGYAFHTHEISQLETVAPVVKGTFQIADGAQIPKIIAQAFQMASGEEPGPVVVEVVHSLLATRSREPLSPPPVPERDFCCGAKEEIEEIVKLISGARQCGIYAGKGAQFSSEKIRRLAEHLSAPVATTISGKGVIAEDHPLAVGFGFGPTGLRMAEDLFKTCDVVLALGVKFSEMSAGKWLNLPDTWIHIDRNKSNLNRNYQAPLALCCDVESALQEVLSVLKDTPPKHNPGVVNAIKRHQKAHLNRLQKASSERAIHPSYFFYQLGQALERDAIVVTDCGAHQLWAATDYCVKTPNSFLTPSDYQAMGFGIPAAIGASLGCPDQCTVCVCGDGGFLMTGFEILTAVRNNLNLAVVIFNDGALGLIESIQRRVYGRTDAVNLSTPDYRKLADAFHVDYLPAANEQQLEVGLKRISTNRGIVILDVQIDYKEWPGYMKGVVRAGWQRLPLMKKIDLVAARAVRLVKHGK